VTPIAEFLIKWNDVHQHFLANPLRPINGLVEVPETPGVGMDLDESKFEDRRELTWD
jgi:L-alanine-DL-glutamate epimerase-like enolase superfamily enzyme